MIINQCNNTACLAMRPDAPVKNCVERQTIMLVKGRLVQAFIVNLIGGEGAFAPQPTDG